MHTLLNMKELFPFIDKFSKRVYLQDMKWFKEKKKEETHRRVESRHVKIDFTLHKSALLAFNKNNIVIFGF